MENLCRHCQKPIIKRAGERIRRFYCSHTCYERYSTRVKYYKNIEKTKARTKAKNNLESTKKRYKETIAKHKEWIKEKGLTITQYQEYGYTFLYTNPQVVETLLLVNQINDINQSEQEVKDYKKSYYQKNKERIKEASRNRRLKNKKETPSKVEKTEEEKKEIKKIKKEKRREYYLKYGI
jgi:hypothetical protein